MPDMRYPVMRKFAVLLLLIAFAVPVQLFAQPPETPTWKFDFGGRVTEFNDKKQKDLALEGAVVKLYKGPTEIQSVTTNNSGRFKFSLDPNNEYTVTFTKPGYITKKISISTYNVSAERGEGHFSPYDVEISLFKVFPGLDYSCLDKPIAKIAYNPAPDVDDFDWDKIYTASIQQCVDELKRLEAEARAKQKAYDAAIEKADKAFNGKDWAGAKTAYNEALSYLPNEQYPKDQIAKCDANLGASAKLEADYNNAIKEGNRLFDAGDYAAAKAQYQTATGLKPTEQYPKDRITLCDAKIAEAGKKASYDAAIKDADAKFNAKDWTGAKTKYQEASGLMPTEAYPKDQITKCDAEIGKAANKAKYDAAIADADAKFKAADYANAKVKYQEASNLITTEQYPKDQIVKCDTEIAKSANKAKYDAAIADADAKFKAADYTGAKTKYQEASAMMAAEQYPKDQIVKCDAEIAKKGLRDKYDAAIKDADGKFGTADYAGAKVKYQEASGLISTEQYPKDQIVKCDAEIAKKGLQEQYDAAIKAADYKFKTSDWAGAKAKYQEASNLKSAETYPKDQIVKCDAEIAKKGIQDQYDAAIKAADTKFNANDFAGAKTEYQKASGLKSAEQYPKDQIVKCDAEIAKKGLQEQYDAAIKAADTKFNAKDWAGAKTEYQKASGLKSAEQYPKDQIVKCDEEIVKKGVQDQYNAAIKDADAKYKAADWTGAKAKYQEALGIKSGEQYPTDQIVKCDAEIAKKGLNEQFNKLITDADTKFKAADYSGAKSLYQQALDLKSAEAYPKAQIVKCDTEIAKKGVQEQYDAAIKDADAKFNSSDWAGAKVKYQEASALKSAEIYPKDQIKKCDTEIAKKGVQEQYDAAIKDADTKFGASDWAGAKSKYQEASNLKTAEKYPKEQIAKCDAEIAKKGAQEKYDAAIKDADAKFAASDWAGAKTKYQEASNLKTAEQYPKDQIVKCDNNIANATTQQKYDNFIKQADTKFNAGDYAGAKALYKSASDVKTTEQYPKDQMVKCDENIANASVQQKYDAAIKAADAKFKLNDWAGAKTEYQKALGIKAGETYPTNQITICDNNIAAAAERKYTDAIADADKKFDASDWTAAKAKYQEASGMKPAEKYPKDRIILCDQNIAKDGVDKTYNAAIAAADVKFKASDWAGAKAKYNEALGLKSSEQYPKDQIKLCDDNIHNAENLETNYKRKIAVGDSAFKVEDYETAKSNYEGALALKPRQSYPQSQLDEINRRLAALDADHAKEEKYRKTLHTADSLFGANAYALAKVQYQSASTQKPNEQYPKDKMLACDNAIADAKLAAAKKKAYDDLVKKADIKFNAGSYADARKLYQDALKEMPLELYPKQQIAECDKKLNPTAKGPDTTRTPEQIKEDYRNEIARQYPQGVTTIEEKDGGTATLKRIVVIGQHGYVYTKKSYSWGTFYFKDGAQISESTFNYETSPGYVQQQLDALPK